MRARRQKQPSSEMLQKAPGHRNFRLP